VVVSLESEEITKLRERISDLEWRLEQHHRALKEAVEQRDKFVLGAAWGPINAGAFFLTFLPAFYLAEKLIEKVLGWHGVLAWIVSAVIGFVVGFIAFCLMIAYLDRQQKGDESKLWKLPEWRTRDSHE
jgi:hypothetical protein